MLAVLCAFMLCVNYERLNVREDSGQPNAAQYATGNRRMAHFIFWPLVAVGIALDLVSKWAVFSWLEQKPSNTVSIINGFLRLVVAENPGGAFGIAAGKYYLLVAVSALALIVVLAIFLLSTTERKLVPIALGLFAAGVCGNLWDRIFNDGSVRDFIDVYYRQYHWPAFNIADIMLCVAVGLLIVSTVFTERLSRRRGRQHK